MDVIFEVRKLDPQENDLKDVRCKTCGRIRRVFSIEFLKRKSSTFKVYHFPLKFVWVITLTKGTSTIRKLVICFYTYFSFNDL